MRLPRRLASALALTTFLAGPVSAMECTAFDTGERICRKGETLYYGEAGSKELEPMSEEMIVGALLLLGGALAGLADLGGSALSGENSESGETLYSDDGASLSSRGGCTMFSSPGYSFGESFSFSSGC